MSRKSCFIGHFQPLDEIALADINSVKEFLLRATVPIHLKQQSKAGKLASAMKVLLDGSQTSESEFQNFAKLYFEATNKAFKAKMLLAPSPAVFTPIGMLSLHRQFFDITPCGPIAGPVEQVFTVAPKETVEVRLEEVRRRTFEESKEAAQSNTDESSKDSKDSRDFTDKYLERLERSTSASVSANISATYGIVSGGISATKNWADTESRAREKIIQIGSEVSQRTAQTVARTFSVRTRSTEELTQSDSYRKLIQNDTDKPINYGLVRFHNKVTTRSQVVDRYLCWRFYIAKPGTLLARGEVITQNIVPNSSKLTIGRPEQIQIVLTSEPSAKLTFPNLSVFTVTPVDSSILSQLISRSTYSTNQLLLVIPSVNGAMEVIAGSGLLDVPYIVPTPLPPLGVLVWKCRYTITAQLQTAGANLTDTETSVKVYFKIFPTHSKPLGWPTDKSDLDTVIEAFRQDLILKLENLRDFKTNTDEGKDNKNNKALQELIEAERSTTKRAARDLRIEESWVVQKYMADLVTDPASSNSRSSEREVVHYFDIDKIFHIPVGMSQPKGTIYPTLAGKPAPLGSSIGWQTSADADETRNRFANAEELEVVVPILHGQEKDALNMLVMRKLIAPNLPNMKTLLDDISIARQTEADFGSYGPDDVTGISNNPTPPPGLDDYYKLGRSVTIDVPIEGFGYKSIIIP
jgi:hypothetical protein